MSDQNSESSGEWVVLNENDELSLDNVDGQPLNLELSYVAVCDAVSESIRSSLSSEELEWQYEQFQDYISQYGSSCVEELDCCEFECTEDLDVNHAEDNDTSKCTCASDFDDDRSVDIAPVSKIHCYKHNRNDRLNFILNLMLALVVASAIGLGTGHFLGWSHKCYKSATEYNAVHSSNLPDEVLHSSKLPDAVTIKQNVKKFVNKDEKVMSSTLFSENLSDISCWDPKDGGSPMYQEICTAHVTNDIINDAGLPQTSIPMSEDVLELKTDEINQNNFSDTGLSYGSNLITHVDWYKIAHSKEPPKDLNEQLERPSLQEISFLDTEKSFPEEISAIHINDNLAYKDIINNAESDLLKQFYVKDKSSNKESNLTNQLRQDFSQVIQSLSALAVARLTDVSDSYPLLIENSGIIVNYYKDIENLINLKLMEIDNFVLSTEYKNYGKISLKHLQKMVYSLIDTIDYLMKMSIKILSRDNKRINVYKFSNNIAKVIFNFNKRWEKNSRYWSEIVDKVKFQEIKEKSFKKGNKHWKRKVHFEKEYRNSKYKRYAMKS